MPLSWNRDTQIRSPIVWASEAPSLFTDAAGRLVFYAAGHYFPTAINQQGEIDFADDPSARVNIGGMEGFALGLLKELLDIEIRPDLVVSEKSFGMAGQDTTGRVLIANNYGAWRSWNSEEADQHYRYSSPLTPPVWGGPFGRIFNALNHQEGNTPTDTLDLFDPYSPVNFAVDATLVEALSQMDAVVASISAFLTGVILANGTVPFAANQSMGGFLLTNVMDPANPQDAATKNYVDTAVAGAGGGGGMKTAVRAASIGANIVLSGTYTLDGVALSVGDRVLAKDQSAPAQNGIWVVAAGAWSRATDLPAGALANSAIVAMVEEGAVNGDTGWELTSDRPLTVGGSTLAFKRAVSDAPGYRASGTIFPGMFPTPDAAGSYANSWDGAPNVYEAKYEYEGTPGAAAITQLGVVLQATTGSATYALVATTQGVWSLSSGVNPGDTACLNIACPNNATQYHDPTQRLVFEVKFDLASYGAGGTVRIGLTDTITGAPMTGAWFNGDLAVNPNWQCFTNNLGGGPTLAGTSAVSVGTPGWHRFRIEFDGTTYFFYIDGALVGSTTLTLPAVNVRLTVQCETTIPGMTVGGQIDKHHFMSVPAR